MRGIPRVLLACLCCLLLGRASVVLAAGPTPDSWRIEPQVLSSRADMVSGGDVLIRVPVPLTLPPSAIRVMLGEADITSRFSVTRNRLLIARLTGLPVGAAKLEVWVGQERAGAINLLNHPVSGPIFSGPQEQPFLCQTMEFRLPGGNSLGEPLDAHCSVDTRVDYFYRSSAEVGVGLKPLSPEQPEPTDIASIILQGESVRYIVRLQTGTVNRAIYQIATLHDPYRDESVAPWHAWPGWNNRLVYAFGGGCNGGWNRQGSTVGDVLNRYLLEQGYAIASSSLNVFGNNCNEVLAAETMAMVKERFIESVGVPKFTVGWGCSGGSYQQHFIADGYPGLLDGIVPGCSFPDLLSSIVMLHDLTLVQRYFEREDIPPFDRDQQRAVAGVATRATLRHGDVQRGIKRIAVRGFVPDGLAPESIFDPVANPQGARLNVFAHAANFLGRDPKSGASLRPLDNVGVQYGLQALRGGLISMEQFIDLNEKIGGYDDQGRPSAVRSHGSAQALAAAYRAGLLVGRGSLANVPIIDYRAYADDRDGGDLHLRYHSFAMRERLAQVSPGVANHIMFVEDMRYGLYSDRSPLLREALRQMDVWLTAVADDRGEATQAEKVRRHRPADLLDTCMTRADTAEKVTETMHPISGKCAALYPAPAAPRAVAGAPLAGDTLKCSLKPLARDDYPAMTLAQWQRLQGVFAEGVCEWRAPGIGQAARGAIWARFPLQLPPPGDGAQRPPVLTVPVLADSAVSQAPAGRPQSGVVPP